MARPSPETNFFSAPSARVRWMTVITSDFSPLFVTFFIIHTRFGIFSAALTPPSSSSKFSSCVSKMLFSFFVAAAALSPPPVPFPLPPAFAAPAFAAPFFARLIGGASGSTPLGWYPNSSIHRFTVCPSEPSALTTRIVSFQFLCDPLPASFSICDAEHFLPSG